MGNKTSIITLIILLTLISIFNVFLVNKTYQLKRINAEQAELIQMKDKQISLLVILATGDLNE